MPNAAIGWSRRLFDQSLDEDGILLASWTTGTKYGRRSMHSQVQVKTAYEGLQLRAICPLLRLPGPRCSVVRKFILLAMWRRCCRAVVPDVTAPNSKWVDCGWIPARRPCLGAIPVRQSGQATVWKAR